MPVNDFSRVKIADHVDQIEFDSNNIAVCEVNGKMICLGRHDGKLFAFAHKCPHAGALLSEGFIDALGNVVCPMHRYRFTLRNGYNCSGEGYYLKTWNVVQQADGVFVDI